MTVALVYGRVESQTRRHEAPAVSSTSTDTLAAGHVVTVEPGVYLPEYGGVRIEDTVVVTETGSIPVTHSPKELMV